MCKKYSEEDLNSMDHAAKNDVIYQMQERLDSKRQIPRLLLKLLLVYT